MPPRHGGEGTRRTYRNAWCAYPAAFQTAHRLASLALDLGDARLRMLLEGITRSTGTRPRRHPGSAAQDAGDIRTVDVIARAGDPHRARAVPAFIPLTHSVF